MPAGFQDLRTIVPQRPRTRFRLGYVTVEDYNAGRIPYDPDVMAMVENCLSKTGLCLVVGPRNRGKTVLAKTIGLRFLNSTRAAVRYGSIAAIDPAEAIDDIKNNNEFVVDKVLYIVEDCHVDVDRTLQLIEALASVRLKSASVLLTSREVGKHVLLNRKSAVSDLDAEGLVILLEPQEAFVKNIVRAAIPGVSDVVIEATVKELVRDVEGSADLAVIVETLNYATSTGAAPTAVSEAEVLRSVVELKLAGSSRDLLLRTSAIAQFDAGVAAEFVESGGLGREADGLVAQGILRRETSEVETGLYYWLDESSDAEIYLRAAEQHNLLGSQTEEQFVRERTVEYLKGLPSNARSVLSGAEAQAGTNFVRSLLAAPAMLATFAELAVRAPIGAAAGLFALLRRANQDAASQVLAKYRDAAGDDAVINRLETAHLAESYMFLSTAARLGNVAQHWTTRLDGRKIANKIDPKSPIKVDALVWFKKHAPSVWTEILASGKISALGLADSLRNRRLQPIFWALRDLKREGYGVTPAAVIAELGAATWVLGALPTQPLSTIGSFLNLLKDVDPHTYEHVLRKIDFDGLAEAARTGSANGLHNFLPSVPLPHRAELLGRLSEADWRDIAARSTLAALANMLENLIHHPLGSLGSSVATNVANCDLGRQIRAARVGVIGRFANNLLRLQPETLQETARQIAELRPDELRHSIQGEPSSRRLERLGLLIKVVREVDHSAAMRLGQSVVQADTANSAEEATLEKLQIFLYTMMTVHEDLARRWLHTVRIENLSERVMTSSDMENVLWLIWNAFRTDQAIGEHLLLQFSRRVDLEVRLSHQALPIRLCFLGLAQITGVRLPVQVGESSDRIAVAINEAASPSIVCLAGCGVAVGLNDDVRSAVFSAVRGARFADQVHQVEKFASREIRERLGSVLRTLSAT